MDRPTLYLDTESYNEVDISVGTYRYAETAEILLIQWAIDDGPVQVWDHNDGVTPPDFVGWVRDNNARVIAHYAMHDRNVLRLGNLKQDIPIEHWECTMTQAYQHALPGGLDALGKLLGLPQDQQKLADGKKLIHRFCKPAPSNHKADRYTRDSHPDEWARFVEYGKQDVIAMREVHKRLPRWNWQQDDIDLYHLDQKINDRGFAVDIDLVRAGAAAATAEKIALAQRFAELTGGLAPTQREKIKDYLAGHYGLRLSGTAKHIIEPISKDESQPPAVREICQIMLSANKTSTAKYETLLNALSADGRFRGGLQMAGALRTRRWAGRVFQPHNLPSRGLPKADLVELYIEALKADCHREVFDDLMLYGAAAIRGVVVAQ